MSRLIWLFVFYLLLVSSAIAAPFLICDPQAGVTKYKISYDGCVTFLPTPSPAQPDGSMKFDLAALPPGVYHFCAEAQNDTQTSGPSETITVRRYSAPTKEKIGN